MSIRLSGLVSGMDTDSMVQELVKASSTKKDDLTKAQTKLSWSQDAWKALNTKVYSFYSKSLTNMHLEGSYSQKKTTIADSKIATVISGNNAVNGTQSLAVKQLATSGYLTGAKLSNDKSVKSTSTMEHMGVLSEGESVDLKVSVGDGEETTISISSTTTMADLVKQLGNAGVNASFDENNQRIYISSKVSGSDGEFHLSADGLDGQTALLKLGLLESDTNDAVRINAQDAKIELNGAEYTSSSNTFTVNGLTITAQSVSEKDAVGDYVSTSINTEDDVDGIYNMIKDFFKEYNSLINEMDSLYNATSAKGYEPLTSDEKEAMSDTEVTDWEKKIKDALLRRDSNLGDIINSFKTSMLGSYEIDGEKYSLSSFGINTLSYFLSADNEKGAYHIDGDADDTSTSANDDKLKAAIASDPALVTTFFSKLTTGLYETLKEKMSAVEDTRSIYKIYDDKRMQNEYNDYKDKIDAAQEKLTALEDRYYKQFSSMETAMSKLNSTQSVITNMFGGS